MTANKMKPIIGMEVHVELDTESKMFCECSAEHFRVKPNSHICPVCTGLPGALPVPNEEAIERTIMIGLALGCQINRASKFDRKHYFYPDLPKGYQISQYDLPFCYEGKMKLSNGKEIGITRVHLEEDTGKLSHKNGVSLIDYNRSGVPLVEIVSEPDIESAAEAKEYLKLLRNTVRFLGVSDADMEKGSMRLEANISVMMDDNWPEYKVEVKNVNSFRYIELAIEYEIERQKKVLLMGKVPRQETRGWSLNGKKTVVQRVKEEAKDYRYFPEPDIPVIELSQKQVDEIETKIALLPIKVRDDLQDKGVRKQFTDKVIEDRNLAEYVLELVRMGEDKKIKADDLVSLVVNKDVDWRKLKPAEVIDEYQKKNNREYLSAEQTEEFVDRVIEENESAVSDYRKGKGNAIQFLLGQAMKLSQGKVNPELVMKLIREKLV